MTALATLALFGWPVVALVLANMVERSLALIILTILGYLFLPEAFGFDLPGLPAYEKSSAIALALVLAAVAVSASRRATPEKQHLADPALGRLFVALAITLLVANVFTILFNRSVIVTGPVVRNAMSPRDLVAMTIDVLVLLVPYFFARRWLATPERHTQLAAVMVGVGLFYTLLVLFELRMSPQLNRWLYGYFPHHWVQHLRGGGFRPIVFLSHGLEVGFFLFMVTVAAFALWRQYLDKNRLIALVAGGWSLLVLLISYNLGAAMLALLFVPVVLIFSPRIQVNIAAVVAVIFLAYPAIRHYEAVPYTSFTNSIASYSPQRAASLQYRLDNETALLDRAYEQPLFGWGGWARNLIYDERGRLLSVTDGTWIIVIGQRGWVGYLAFFGLICLPILFLRRAARRKPIPPVTAGLAIIGAGNLIYLIPNSTLSPINWLIFGALAGFAQTDVAKSSDTSEAATTPERDRPRYTRFGHGDTPAPVSRSLADAGATPRQRAPERYRNASVKTRSPSRARFTRE